MARNLCNHFRTSQILFFLFIFFSTISANVSFHSKSSAWVVDEGKLFVPDTSHIYGWKNSSIIKNTGYTDNNWTGYPTSPWTHTNLPSLDVINNSNVIVKNTLDIRANSNAIVSGGAASALSVQNSNAIIKNDLNIKNNSNAIVKNTLDIRTNSNAIVAGGSSSALSIQNSNAIIKNALNIKNNSNAIVKNTLNIRSNSSAIVKNTADIASTIGDVLLRVTSNALLYGLKNNSNAIISGGGGTGNYEGNLTINGPTYSLAKNRFVNPTTSNIYFTGDTVFDGNNNYIQFSDSVSSIHISPGVTVTFSNVVFKDLTDSVFDVGTGAHIIFDTGTVIEILRPTILTNNWLFTGDSLIYGYNNTLDLALSNIQVANNSVLRMHSINITGLKNSNLFATNPNDQIILQNTTLQLSNNFSYNTGRLNFINDVLITGTNKFTYATDQQSNIASQSQVTLDTGVTFEYNTPIANRDLLAMTDQTSRLILNGCTLSSTTTGLRLTKGTLVIEHKNNLYNDGANALSEGFCLGNGTLAGELTIEVKPGASIDLKSGFLDYANV